MHLSSKCNGAYRLGVLATLGWCEARIQVPPDRRSPVWQMDAQATASNEVWRITRRCAVGRTTFDIGESFALCTAGSRNSFKQMPVGRLGRDRQANRRSAGTGLPLSGTSTRIGGCD